ncbi:hypothetical protein FB451DRAFT_1394338 [Mycena latifolia]|nr:hypothetical protein FB451DRAFT_1394338 [Mycena latifolia]
MSLPQSAAVSVETFTDAEPPFSGEPQAAGAPTDLILRSTDCVDFHVHKGILSVVSPVFWDMEVFHPDELKDGKPIVRVHDPSSALERLLRLFYPFLVDSQPHTLDGLEFALIAAEKYQITDAVSKLMGTLTSFVNEEPYRVFAIALRRGLVDIMNAAALATLEEPFLSKREDLLVFQPEVRWAQILLQLHDFRTECSTNAVRFCKKYRNYILSDDIDPPFRVAIYDAVWWTPSSDGHGEGCGAALRVPFPDDDAAPTIIEPAKWFMQHMDEAAQTVAICPTAKHVREAVLNTRGANYECPKCKKQAQADMEKFFVDELAAKVTASNLETVGNTNFTLD